MTLPIAAQTIIKFVRTDRWDLEYFCRSFYGFELRFSSVYQMEHIFLLIVQMYIVYIYENAFMIYCYSLRFASFSSVTKDWLVAKHLNLSRLQTIAVFSLYFAVFWIQIDRNWFWSLPLRDGFCFSQHFGYWNDFSIWSAFEVKWFICLKWIEIRAINSIIKSVWAQFIR